MKLEDFVTLLELHLPDYCVECESEDPISVKVTKGDKGVRITPEQSTLDILPEKSVEMTARVIKEAFERERRGSNVNILL